MRLHECFHNREVTQKGGNQIKSHVVVEEEYIEVLGLQAKLLSVWLCIIKYKSRDMF